MPLHVIPHANSRLSSDLRIHTFGHFFLLFCSVSSLFFVNGRVCGKNVNFQYGLFIDSIVDYAVALLPPIACSLAHHILLLYHDLIMLSFASRLCSSLLSLRLQSMSLLAPLLIFLDPTAFFGRVFDLMHSTAFWNPLHFCFLLLLFFCPLHLPLIARPFFTTPCCPHLHLSFLFLCAIFALRLSAMILLFLSRFSAVSYHPRPLLPPSPSISIIFFLPACVALLSSRSARSVSDISPDNLPPDFDAPSCIDCCVTCHRFHSLIFLTMPHFIILSATRFFRLLPSLLSEPPAPCLLTDVSHFA